MPRTLLSLLLVLGAVSLASCGKGGGTTVTISSPGARTGGSGEAGGSKGNRSTPPGGGNSPSRERALAFARAVNLTADDVPGFTASAKHSSSSAREKRLEREMVRCAGTAGLGTAEARAAGGHKALADQDSKEFELKHGIIDFSVSSQVSVQASAAEARKGLTAIRSAHVRNCFSRYLQLIFEGQRVKGAKTGPVSIQAGIPPAPGTSGGFGWRITASFIVRGIKVPIYLDFLGFVKGPAEVTLLSSGLIRPFPAEVQQHLFALLLARAREHAL
ncbi:MAG TPA: hypothetical protein VN672_05055 [Solirubrobacteraceae bacterium]|nr:hypothetical protein [Solirubrobacteraceae bacterium]